MQELKYVVVRNEYGSEVPILFCPTLEHRTVANGYNVVAAGFVQIEPEAELGEDGAVGYIDVRCHGQSVSLDVRSRHDVDEALICRQLGMEGSP